MRQVRGGGILRGPRRPPGPASRNRSTCAAPAPSENEMWVRSKGIEKSLRDSESGQRSRLGTTRSKETLPYSSDRSRAAHCAHRTLLISPTFSFHRGFGLNCLSKSMTKHPHFILRPFASGTCGRALTRRVRLVSQVIEVGGRDLEENVGFLSIFHAIFL